MGGSSIGWKKLKKPCIVGYMVRNKNSFPEESRHWWSDALQCTCLELYLKAVRNCQSYLYNLLK